MCFCEQLNFDRLLSRMWDEMGLVRVYTKPQGQQPDFAEPVVLSAVCCLIIMLIINSCPLFYFTFLKTFGFFVVFLYSSNPSESSLSLANCFRIEVAAL